MIVISDSDMPQVTHSIEEEENSSNEVIANSKETVTGPIDQEQVNTVPSAVTNTRTHDLLTVSIDSTLGKLSQIEVPSFLSLSQKSTVTVSPYDSLVNAPTEAEVMYVADTVRCNDRGVSKETTASNSSKVDESSVAASKRPEVIEAANEVSADDQSDPIAPFSITLTSSDSDAVSATCSQEVSSGTPPSEERVAVSSEERASCEEDQTLITDSTAESSGNSDDIQGKSSETEAFSNTGALPEVLDTCANVTKDLSDAQATNKDVTSLEAHETQSSLDSQVLDEGEHDIIGIPDVISSNQQSAFEVPQINQPQLGEAVDSCQRRKGICGSSELFDPPRKQIPESGDYGQLYACSMLDTPSLPSQYRSKDTPVHDSTSLTSLASASTETIHSESSDSLDVNPGGSDERSTILKCITDNSFLEFLITEGLELDSCSKQGVVGVVMTQYNNKLSSVENAIPKLAAQIRQTETTIDQQTQKVKQLQDELEFVKGEIVKNEKSLQGFISEQQGLSKQRKALKRKVARCEGTMKKLLGNAKKSRLV